MERMATTLVLLLTMSALLPAHSDDARLAITQPALIVQCFNGTVAAPRTRSWTVTGPVTLALTMRNQPRPGMAPAGDSDPGTAVIDFTPEPGHRYEVEVRAAAATFSQRVWPKGGWTPVVRDRTTDSIVSGTAEWADSPPCAPRDPGADH
jgi:hypothetical protein